MVEAFGRKGAKVGVAQASTFNDRGGAIPCRASTRMRQTPGRRDDLSEPGSRDEAPPLGTDAIKRRGLSR